MEHTGLLTFFIICVLVVIELNLINIIVLLLIDIIIFDLIGRKATSYVILSSPTLVLREEGKVEVHNSEDELIVVHVHHEGYDHHVRRALEARARRQGNPKLTS